MAQAAEAEVKFFNTIAKALGRKEPLTKPPERDEIGPPAFWKEQKFEHDEPLKIFKTNLENLTGRVVVVKSKQEVQQQLKEWIQELGAKSVVMWDHEQLKEVVEPDNLGCKVDVWNGKQSREQMIKLAAQADVGLTWADYAIGYTGTLALFSNEGQGRSVSLLPPSHIAVFRRSHLVPTMSTVMANLRARLGNNELPSSVTFITGPSRTSDIEMDLSIGVHGPYRVWTIVLDDM